MSCADWEKIRTEYLHGSTSQRKLAEKYGVSYNTLKKRATVEKWFQQRETINRKSAAKAQQKIVSQRAKDIEALARTRSLLITRLERAVSQSPDITGNRLEQSISELIPSDDDERGGAERRNVPKAKTVKLESDLLKMVTALEKLIAMSGYDVTGERGADVLNEIIEAVKNV